MGPASGRENRLPVQLVPSDGTWLGSASRRG